MLAARMAHLKEKLVKLEEELAKLAAYEKQMLATPDSRSRSPIPIVARWQAAVAARALSAISCRWRSIPSII